MQATINLHPRRSSFFLLAALIAGLMVISFTVGCNQSDDDNPSPCCAVVPAAIVLADGLLLVDKPSPYPPAPPQPDDNEPTKVCPRCDGAGTDGRVACRRCNGSGRITAAPDMPPEPDADEEDNQEPKKEKTRPTFVDYDQIRREIKEQQNGTWYLLVTQPSCPPCDRLKMQIKSRPPAVKLGTCDITKHPDAVRHFLRTGHNTTPQLIRLNVEQGKVLTFQYWDGRQQLSEFFID